MYVAVIRLGLVRLGYAGYVGVCISSQGFLCIDVCFVYEKLEDVVGVLQVM